MTTTVGPSTAVTLQGPGRGALRVAEYRLRNMWKWRNAILAFGLGNPVLYLASIGLGVGLLVAGSLVHYPVRAPHDPRPGRPP